MSDEQPDLEKSRLDVAGYMANVKMLLAQILGIRLALEEMGFDHHRLEALIRRCEAQADDLVESGVRPQYPVNIDPPLRRLLPPGSEPEEE